MQNFRIVDLKQLIKKLSDEGVTIIGVVQSYEYGNFGWLLDVAVNNIKLWEPIDSLLQ